MCPSVRSVPWPLLWLWLTASGLASQAQNLAPNPHFAAGTGPSPAGWTEVGGTGTWAPTATGNGRVLRVEGHGDDTASWRSSPLPLQPGTTYRLRFSGRLESGTSGGTVSPVQVPSIGISG